MKKTTFAALTAGITASALLAACGTGGTGTGPAAGPVETLSTGAQVSGTITFWHGYSAGGEEVSALEKGIIPAFEKLHPGTTVKSVQVPSDQMHQKLVTAVAAGSLPDVIRTDIVTVPELAKLGVLTPLDQAMPDFKTWADKMFPGPLATNKYKNSYWGLPLDTNTKVMLYNDSALKAAGLTGPAKTLADLKSQASSVTGGKYLFAEGGSAAWNMLPFIWSNGGDMTNPELTKATGYLNGPKSVEAVQLLVDLYSAKQLPSIILGGSGGVSTSDGLAKGTYASIVDGPWTFPNLNKSFPSFNPQTAPMFSGAGGSVSVVGGEDIVMSSGSENKALGAEFIRYMLSDEAQVAMGKTGQLSARADLSNEMNQLAPYYAPFLEQLKTAKGRPATPQWAKIDDIFTKAVQTAFQGKVTVQQALDDAAAKIDPLLAQG